MIDIHTHIFPGIDDGARNIDDTLDMLSIAADCGTEVIVATPHCNIPDMYDNYFSSEYINLYRRVTAQAKAAEIPIKILPGMEVFTTNELPRLIRDGKIMTLNKTRYLLMEFDFREDPEYADEMLEKVSATGAIPVVAHVERYEFIQDDPQMIWNWSHKGYIIQVNKGSFEGKFGRAEQHTAYRLMDHRLVNVIASDAHRPYSRTPDLRSAYDLLLEDYQEPYLHKLFETNPMRICCNKEVPQFKRISFEE